MNPGFVRARNGSITTFDAPGAGTASGQGTSGLGTDPAGTIAGAYTDTAGMSHGLMRARDGAITAFDAPGAATGPGLGTGTWSINTRGAVTGISYADGVVSGFIRIP